MTRTVQLILPGLFDLPLQELEPGFVADELPRLNRILRFARPLANRDYSIDAMLRAALALAPADTSLPLAQAFVTNEKTANRSLLIEAIHLRADLHNAIAMPIPESPENIQDINNIINGLGSEFKVDFDLSAVAPGRYLVQLKAFDPPTHYPHPLSVMGKSVNPFIEQSRRVLPWYRLLNEMQMFMHQHAVNQQRMTAGRLPINSLWAWGAGPRPELASRPAWFCDDPVLNRFAESLGLAAESCAGLEAGSNLEQSLIVDLRLLQFLKAGLQERLERLLLDIENKLLKPLPGMLAGRRSLLRVRAGYRFDLELRSGDALKFWRRRASLASWRD